MFADMKSEKEITIVPKNTYTKSEYAKAYQISRPTVDSKIKSKEIKSVEVNGTTLILA
jgi:hypothetical protein